MQFDEPALGLGKPDVKLATEALAIAVKDVGTKTALYTYFGSLNGSLGALMKTPVDVIGVDVFPVRCEHNTRPEHPKHAGQFVSGLQRILQTAIRELEVFAPVQFEQLRRLLGFASTSTHHEMQTWPGSQLIYENIQIGLCQIFFYFQLLSTL